jgi:uncharacterized glyoxalase superfamily protein PhnB
VRQNQSIPRATVIPQLGYRDVGEASRWLCDVFGFTVRLQIANHRVQMNVGDGAMVVTEAAATHSPGWIMVRVDSVDDHHARAMANGARVVNPPTDYPYGERQYTVEDLGGHRWTFTQSIADVAPETWGGVWLHPGVDATTDDVAHAALRLAEAIGRRDRDTIRSLLAPGFTHRTHGGPVVDAESFLRAIEEIPGEITSVQLHHMKVDLCPSGALVTGIQHAQVRVAGALLDDRRAFVDWFVHDGSGWRIQAAVDLTTDS